MPAAKAPYRILVTDDDDGVRNALARFLVKLGYDVMQADGGEAALDILAHGNFAAMLCDIRMPGMTGVELLPKVIAQDADLAVIMLTAVGDPGSAIQCLKLGASDYLIKPVELEELAHSLQFALRKRELEIERREMEAWLSREVAEKTKELSEQARQVELLSFSILMALVDASDPPGPEGGRNHSMRVANLSAHVAAELRLDPEAIEEVRLAARLHDLGRVAARHERLSRARDGAAPADSPAAIAAHVLEPLRRHAEVTRIIGAQDQRYDAGFPDSMPLGSRIVAVVNRFDELTESEQVAGADALAEIQKEAGTVYDPGVVIALAAVVGRRGR